MNKIFFIAILAMLLSCNTDKKAPLDSEETVSLPPYEVLRVDDISRKNQTTAGEDKVEDNQPEKHAYVKRVRGKVLLNNSIVNKDLDTLFEEIISEITEEDFEIDELILYLYSDRELQNRNHDLGMIIWAPQGKLGRVTPEIASQNKRENYQVIYELYVEDLEAYFKAKETDPLL